MDYADAADAAHRQRQTTTHHRLPYALSKRPRRNINASQRSCFHLLFFFVLFSITICGLSLVPLGITSSHEAFTAVGNGHDVGDEHKAQEIPSHPEKQQQKPTPASRPHETSFVSAPRIRDGSEYILDPDWDYDAAPVTREYDWDISVADLNPDGVYRPMYLINNQFPGPLVECNDGDTIVVRVHNRAVNATALHFHGLFYNGTNAMDGAVGITQCPIAPNSSFIYTFQVKGQSGTYWYHAHHSAQASDGLLGPVVIHARNERTTLQELEYASDRIVMVQDHYHNLTSELLMDYLKPDMENDEPVPDNALINGRGVRECSDFPGWRCDTANVSVPVWHLAANKRHRLRFINVGAFAEFQIQFDEHPFYVTEVDGTDVHPEPFHRLNILPAQRYSVILETNVTTAESYWMRARMVSHCFATENKHLKPEVRAIVSYRQEDKRDDEVDDKKDDNEIAGESQSNLSAPHPTSKDWSESIEVICRDLNISALHPVIAQSPPPADEYVLLRANVMIGDWALARGYFNSSTWHANATHPSLHRYIDGMRALALQDNNSSSLTPSLPRSPALTTSRHVFDADHEYVLETSGYRIIDLAISNFDDDAHPFHLHGHRFFILAQGRSGYPPTEAELPQRLRGALDNPVRRDTVTVEGYGWVVIRVVLDNPGLWPFHCHNTWHAEAGMVMQFLVASDQVRDWTVADDQRDLCRRDGVERGSRPPDSIWFGHF